jgi:predicted TIM-barrel fold metal-dependent hydrolase
VATRSAELEPASSERPAKLPVIDTDAHVGNTHPLVTPDFMAYLPEKWREYCLTFGLRTLGDTPQTPGHRAFAHRTDAVPAGGGIPGSDPDLAREQLLDLYDVSAAVLNDIFAVGGARGSNNYPLELQVELARAANDYHRDAWLAADDRWYASIVIPVEDVASSVHEIHRCMESGDRFCQVLLELRQEFPIGNPRYWPIFEACSHYDIPVAFHVMQHNRPTPCGHGTSYFEAHCYYPLRNFHLVTSLVFEGVFERFPTLKIALIEQGWSWAVPLAWRMDASWRVLRDEVKHLDRKPSEYLRDHFWFSTQPIEEPEHEEDFADVWEMLEDFGSADKLMYSSDYPHWDFDAPTEVLPETMPLADRRRILGENASRLYKIPLREGSGIPAA